MANPQADEFTRISNELLERFCSIRIPGEAMQVLLVILRKTYGYNRKSDKISLSYFSEHTNMPVSNCSRAIKKLEIMNLISVIRDKYISEYSIQKDYEQWIPTAPKFSNTINIDTVNNDSKTTINIDSNTINNDSETTINNDRYKRKKESLKESKERGTSLTSQKITSEELKTFFQKYSKISEPNQKTHINPILEALENIPPELTKNDITHCLNSVFSKLRKDKGVMMNFLIENIRKSISAKHESVLLTQKQQRLKQAELEKLEIIQTNQKQLTEEAKKYRLQNAEKIIKYSEFFSKNKHLFSTMEKYEIESAFKNNSIMLVENILLSKMNSS
jgi:phage replication O-like protein O